MTLLEILKQYNDAVKHLELAAFLHDIDKADNHFKEKPVWHTCGDAESPDNAIETKRERWNSFLCKFDLPMPDSGIDFTQIGILNEESVTIANTVCKLSDPFVFHHLNDRYHGENYPFSIPLTGAIVHAGLCGADGFDSALDKARTKDEPGTKQTEPFKIATPFGKISSEWNNSGFFETIRKTFQETSSSIPSIRVFRNLFSCILGETRIPFNDVTLWDHSFSTASFAKSIFAKILMEYHSGIREDGKYILPKRNQGDICQFRYFKFELNRDTMLANAHIAADLHGVDSKLVTLMDSIREFYENEILAGNETYRDHFRQLFTMPVLCKSLNEQFENELRSKLTTFITQKLAALNLDELAFSISWIAPAEGCSMEEILLKGSASLLNAKPKNRFVPQLLQALEKDSHKGRVCDICRLRNALPGRDNDDRLCSVCTQRREDGGEETLSCKGNKLALFSFEANLSKLRDGSLFKDFYKNEKAKPLPSAARISRTYSVLLDFFQTFQNRLALPHISVTCSPERLDFILPADDILGVLLNFFNEFSAECGKFQIPVKAGVTVFYKKFPLYAVIDASSKLRDSMEFGNMDILLLDSADARFSFRSQGRTHHIFGTAVKRSLASVMEFAWLETKLAGLDKSQIGAMESTLISKIFEWGWAKSKTDVFRSFAKMILFAPNAFGKNKFAPAEQERLLNAVSDGALLDVIDIMEHIENKMKGC